MNSSKHDIRRFLCSSYPVAQASRDAWRGDRSVWKYLPLRNLMLAAAFLFAFGLSLRADAANVRFIGSGGYVVSGNAVTLIANEVANLDTTGYSGTLRLELWALPSPYSGVAQNGYKLAEYKLGQLVAGYQFSNINSGPLPLLATPPDGTWYLVLIVTEYYGTSTDDGYGPDDYLNLSPPLVLGPPPPPPPALTPQVGLWWNPNESGSGYAIDYKHGVLVVTIYSYATNGAPQWYLVAGPLSGNTFTGTLDKYVSGQCIACSYSGSPTSVGNDGTVTIVFSSPTSATMYLPGGRVTQIQPEAF